VIHVFLNIIHALDSLLQDYLQGCADKAHKLLGWKPKISFEVNPLP